MRTSRHWRSVGITIFGVILADTVTSDAQARLRSSLPVLCFLTARHPGPVLFFAPSPRALWQRWAIEAAMLSSLTSRSTRRLYSTRFNIAAVDRYSAIRRFFINQNVAPSSATIRSVSNNTRSTLWTLRNTTMVAAIPLRPWQMRTLARAFATNNEQPTKPPPDTEKASKPPEQTTPHNGNSIDHDPGVSPDPFPHARDVENYSRFFQRLALSLPHPHRPTREDFLNVATSFWQRLRIRFKWFTVRGFRKFNADDISAFITWFVMSQTLWILVGT